MARSAAGLGRHLSGNRHHAAATRADHQFTTGIGALAPGIELGGARAQAGDVVLVSGSLGDHGIAVMSQRENLRFDAPVVSDSAALHTLVADLLASGAELHCLRDPTRGGLAATLNEIAHPSGVGIVLNEVALPIKTAVAGACELLGLDPLTIANEGKLVAIVAAGDAERALAALRAHRLGRDAARIGEVIADERCYVQLITTLGGRRMVDWLNGEALPRIC